MTNNDNRVVGHSSEQVVRACPNNGLKQPVRQFGDTFSAENVLLNAFFDKN